MVRSLSRYYPFVLCLSLIWGLYGCVNGDARFAPAHNDSLAASAKPRPARSQYVLEGLVDPTAPENLVVFAFSGGGLRSAAFGFGALLAAHDMKIATSKGQRTLSQEIDILSAASGGSFTAAAYATNREKLLAHPQYFRNNVLGHDFMLDLIRIYLAPWNWRWMLPEYGTNDAMARVYGDVEFDRRADPMFARHYSELRGEGRPLLVIQATDFGNEQSFTFTQNDFDLICSDLSSYPLANAIAASNGFPLLFSPIHLKSYYGHDATCPVAKPAWIADALAHPGNEAVSRRLGRALVAEQYIRPPVAPENDESKVQPGDTVHLLDGGIADNIGLRGLMNVVVQPFGPDLDARGAWIDARRACAVGLGAVRRVLVVSVDGESLPKNEISAIPYLSDLLRVAGSFTNTAIDTSSFETLLAAQALTKRLATRLERLRCGSDEAAEARMRADAQRWGLPVRNEYWDETKKTEGEKEDAAGKNRAAWSKAIERAREKHGDVQPDKVQLSHAVTGYFAHVSFADLDEKAQVNKKPCDDSKEPCTVGRLARSGTSLSLSTEQRDDMISAGYCALLMDRQIWSFAETVPTRSSRALLGSISKKKTRACLDQARKTFVPTAVALASTHPDRH